jgi:hypothetical protein
VKNHESDAPRVPNRRIAGEATAAGPLTPEEPSMSNRGAVPAPVQCADTGAAKDPPAPDDAARLPNLTPLQPPNGEQP